MHLGSLSLPFYKQGWCWGTGKLLLISQSCCRGCTPGTKYQALKGGHSIPQTPAQTGPGGPCISLGTAHNQMLLLSATNSLCSFANLMCTSVLRCLWRSTCSTKTATCGYSGTEGLTRTPCWPSSLLSKNHVMLSRTCFLSSENQWGYSPT